MLSDFNASWASTWVPTRHTAVWQITVFTQTLTQYYCTTRCLWVCIEKLTDTPPPSDDSCACNCCCNHQLFCESKRDLNVTWPTDTTVVLQFGRKLFVFVFPCNTTRCLERLKRVAVAFNEPLHDRKNVITGSNQVIVIIRFEVFTCTSEMRPSKNPVLRFHPFLTEYVQWRKAHTSCRFQNIWSCLVEHGRSVSVPMWELIGCKISYTLLPSLNSMRRKQRLPLTWLITSVFHDLYKCTDVKE